MKWCRGRQDKVESSLQKRILPLEDRGFETILLLCSGELGSPYPDRALLLEPDPMFPPLIATMAGEHEIRVVLPVAGDIQQQAGEWKNLPRTSVLRGPAPG
ncbi:AroM family protein [Erwinia pyrifoliae]|uniref:AroM family protein n=1 Tax=Erwinia pyrifoliae TaxID=79967 RepID=A0ABY5X5D3_ERWPY|nr:AroM family protein [Erwinia pyrifoliae]UWS32580.1 AroM family protein [Erwinia pyrifoliae]